jgi:hypothetical protein
MALRWLALLGLAEGWNQGRARIPAFEAVLLLGLPLLLTLSAFVAFPPFTPRSHQLYRDSNRNRPR